MFFKVSISEELPRENWDRVGDLGNRYCQINSANLYQIDDNLLIVLIEVNDSEELDQFRMGFVKYVIKRMRYTVSGEKLKGLDIQTSSDFIIYFFCIPV